ncbi:nitroreductase family protein [Pleomorphomonas sp. NRK KF1]|uniref:Acg family FMN-binding oxidoreductase n=1 Tax=Pleomorphomonas sp. NRK KF1 TaxID=2943000 RepID=UPI002044A005|nr:nitroreductase family protein [Pleomorphomonas sp. NRK KF1]MCM5555074.1 nitroreductase family protein [Pleomorphomonas sp. NRK KF1]
MNRRSVLLGLGGLAVLAGAGGAGLYATTGSAAAYARYAGGLRALVARPGVTDLVRLATLAANGHNTQPWRFHVTDAEIGIRPDPSRATPVVDPDDHHLFVSLGCAAENLVIAGAATGMPGVLETAPDGSSRYAYARGAPQPDPLLAAIAERQSTRGVYDGRAIAAGEMEALRRAGEMEGVRLVLIDDRARIDQVRDLVVAGNDAQMRDPAFLAELKQWLRFSPRSAMATGDGLYAPASGNPALPDFLDRRAFDLFVTAAAENDKYARQIDSSAGIAIFLGDRADPLHWVKVGQACQRFALTATLLGLRHAFVNQPVEVVRLRPELASLAGEPGLRPDIVMRFGHGASMPLSPRRPVATVMA